MRNFGLNNISKFSGHMTELGHVLSRNSNHCSFTVVHHHRRNRCVLCAILRRSSTIRHHLLVSGRGLRLPVPFEHDQTPIAGVWPCSAPSCTVRARSDTNCWCLVVVCDFLHRSSTTRHQLLVSVRALRHPAPFEHDQTPIAGVWSCSASSCTIRE